MNGNEMKLALDIAITGETKPEAIEAWWVNFRQQRKANEAARMAAEDAKSDAALAAAQIVNVYYNADTSRFEVEEATPVQRKTLLTSGWKWDAKAQAFFTVNETLAQTTAAARI